VTLRERETLFWFVLFPVVLFVLLTAIFGSLGQEGTIHFEIGFVDRDEAAGEGGLGRRIEGILEDLSQPAQEGKEPLLHLHRPAGTEDLAAFQAREEQAVRYGTHALLIVVPEGFSAGVQDALSSRIGGGPAKVQVFRRAGSSSSGFALSILKQVIAGVDQGVLASAGRFRAEDAVVVDTVFLGSARGAEVRYVDFLLPGLVLMAFFTAGLFGVPGALLFAREQRILRRYWVTPFSVSQFLAGFSVTHAIVCALQFTLLVVVGRFALGAEVSFASPEAALFLVLSSATFLAFGFFVASLTKTGAAGMALANAINLPMTFLSGLYYQLGTLPGPLRILLSVNPLSYLADGLRRVIGFEGATSPLWLCVLVPILWMAFSLFVAGRRLSWDVGR
jgi:ABC-2 type transport system permease protein